MGKGLVSVMLLSCILSSPPSTAAAVETISALEIEAINESLRGKIAAIELVNGDTVKKAKKVVVESNFIYWVSKGKEQKVATGEISRITARSKSRGWIGLGAGAGIGILSLVGGSSTDEEDLVAASYGGEIFFATAALAAIGYAVDKAIPRKSTVVFESDVDLPDCPGIGRSFPKAVCSRGYGGCPHNNRWFPL
jgi:hypothetical protein